MKKPALMSVPKTLIKIPKFNFALGPFKVEYWDLATEKAKHNKYVYNKDPLRFALKHPGKINSTKESKQKKLKEFKKYKLKNKPAALNRVKMIGPKWNR